MIPEGYHTANEIAYHLNISKQRIYNIWMMLRFRRIRNPEYSRINPAKYLYPIDKIKKAIELHNKGLTYKQAKRFIRK